MPAVRRGLDRGQAGLARSALTRRPAAIVPVALALALAGCAKRMAGLEYRTYGASASAARHLVVLLHGYGAPGDDLVALARDLERAGAPAGTRFVLPVGPGGSGGVRYWYARDEAREPVRRQVEALVAGLRAQSGLPREHVTLAGYSQGGSLALDAALHAADPPGNVLAISSRAVPVEDTAVPLRVFLAHGRTDAQVPFADGEVMRRALEAKGHRVSWLEHAGGHHIPPEVCQAAARFLAGAPSP